MKILALAGAVTAAAVLVLTSFPTEAPAQSNSYLQCTRQCRTQGCRDDCENAENRRNNARTRPGTIQMKCVHDRRNSEQNCTR